MTAVAYRPETLGLSALQSGPVNPFSSPILQNQLHDYLARKATDRFHLRAIPSSSSAAPSLAPRHEIYDVEESVAAQTSGRTTQQQVPADSIDERGLARIVRDALQAHYGPLKSSIKQVANDAGASVDAAKNWWQGVSPPSSIYLMRLESKVPALAAELRRLRAMETEINPDFQREFTRLMQTMMRAGQV